MASMRHACLFVASLPGFAFGGFGNGSVRQLVLTDFGMHIVDQNLQSRLRKPIKTDPPTGLRG